MTVTVASVLPLAMAALLVCGTAAAPNPMLVDLSPWIRPLPSNVMHWTVLDVETWMNTTIGYPEYSSIVRLHQIDGPTLIGLNVKTAFEPSHPIHAVKLKAHINILRDRCLCEGGAVTDLWSYAQEHTAFVVRLGSLLAYSPRIGWAYVFAFDTSTYNALMGPTLPLFDEGLLGTVEEEKSVVPWYTTILYISFALLAPYLLLVYKVLWVWHLNRFSLSLMIGYALLHQLNDISNVFMFVFALRQRKTTEPIRVVQLFRKTFFGFHQLIPVVVTVASFILPTFVTYLFIYAFFMHFLFDCSVFVFGCVYSLLSRGSSRGEESEAGASNPKKDE